MKYELMQRDGYCRCCGKDLIKNEDKAIKHSYWRNKQDIIICTDCVTEMSELVKDSFPELFLKHVRNLGW